MEKARLLRRVILVVIVVVFAFALVFNYKEDRALKSEPNDFQSCLEAGNPIMESYPRRCSTGEVTFVEDVGNVLSKDQLIRVIEPRPNSFVSSPLTIVGMARGTWFFEGSFPVTLENASGTIAVGVATALTDWMTEEFVSFKSELIFSNSFKGEASLILKKDNPSGLPENDDSLVFPVIIKPSRGVSTTTSNTIDPIGSVGRGCVISGCSSQICAEEEMMSTCEYKPTYACYKEVGVRCERQINGKCGWTETEALKSCLAPLEI